MYVNSSTITPVGFRRTARPFLMAVLPVMLLLCLQPIVMPASAPLFASMHPAGSAGTDGHGTSGLRRLTRIPTSSATVAPALDHALQAASAAPDQRGAGTGMEPQRRAALPDTVRVLAVMVEFQPDSDPRTSGTGAFGTIYPRDYGNEIIDPLPHDRAYFEAHLRFLASYVAKASGGRTQIRAQVLDPIRLSKGIRDYSHRKGESETPVAQLALEAWTLADAAYPQVDFSAWDMFVIFHASRGRDVDLASIQGADPTPFDIPSLSFTLDGFRRLLGSGFPGIPVDGGAAHITNTAVLPTTNVREIPLITGETGLLELTINGLLAASFGTWAGLPDLFDTKRGTTGIGRFGLMDPEGIFAYGGICPPAPSAWEKQQLGWTQPREAGAGRRQYFLTAQRTDQPATADVIRVPITAREYWLLENRQRDPGGNGQRITMWVGGQDVEFRAPKDTTGFENGSISSLRGVVVDVEDLDWSLPGGTVISDGIEQRVGGGVLIWHVDEQVISAGRASNTVNADPFRRGVDLEQAGGPQDIGRPIQTIFGTSTGTGSPLDYWFRDNISPLYTNAFSALTRPDSRANNGAWTHVTMDEFSSPGPLMSLSIALGDNTLAPLPGWPVNLAGTLGSDSADMRVQTFDLDGDGQHEVLTAAAGMDSVYLFCHRLDGSSFSGGDVDAPVAVLPGSRVVTAPLAGQVGSFMLVGLVASDSVHTVVSLLDPSSAVSTGRFQTVFRRGYRNEAFGSGSGPAATAFILHDGVFVYRTYGGAMDTITGFRDGVSTTLLNGEASAGEPLRLSALGGSIAFTGSGNPSLRTFQGAPTTVRDGATARITGAGYRRLRNAVTGDLDGDGFLEAVYGTASALRVVAPSDDARTSFLAQERPGAVALESAAPVPAIADVDGDGRHDVVIADGNRVMALNGALAVVDHYPAGFSAGQVLAARLAGDRQDALFIVGDGLLSQVGTGARQADGFPVPLPGRVDVVLFPLGSSTQRLGIAAAGDGARVLVYDTQQPLATDGLRWRSSLADAGNTCTARPLSGGPVSADMFFPPERCYNWPNPAYHGNTRIRFYVAEDADVRVRITDLAGVVVAELGMRATGGFDNELEWDVRGTQSGVYLAKIDARAGARTGEKIIKIAVVR